MHHNQSWLDYVNHIPHCNESIPSVCVHCKSWILSRDMQDITIDTYIIILQITCKLKHCLGWQCQKVSKKSSRNSNFIDKVLHVYTWTERNNNACTQILYSWTSYVCQYVCKRTHPTFDFHRLWSNWTTLNNYFQLWFPWKSSDNLCLFPQTLTYTMYTCMYVHASDSLAL